MKRFPEDSARLRAHVLSVQGKEEIEELDQSLGWKMIMESRNWPSQVQRLTRWSDN